MEVNDLRKRVGPVIQRRRLEARMGQERLAEEAGIHRTNVGMLERGDHLPSLEVLLRLANALKTTLTELMAEIEDVEKEIVLPPPLPKGRPKSQAKVRRRTKTKGK